MNKIITIVLLIWLCLVLPELGKLFLGIILLGVAIEGYSMLRLALRRKFKRIL